MELWTASLILAGVCFIIGLSVREKSGRNPSPPTQEAALVVKELKDNMSSEMTLPAEWSEASITQQLQQLREQRPSLIPHFVESVKERFILRQDDRTAEIRIAFLRRQIEQLKLAKEFQQTVDDLELLGLEKSKRVKTLQLETEKLEGQRQSQSELDRLATLRERKRIELEIAQLDQQIENAKNPPKAEAKLSPEEQRNKDKTSCEARIQTLKQEKQKALKLNDAEERVQRVNAIDDAIQREMERWAKFL